MSHTLTDRDERRDTAGSSTVVVRDVHKTFRIPHRRHSSFKERVVHPLESYSYDLLPALEDISFEVRRGEFFGIVGRNGSGKSTLLKCVAGIYDVDDGEVAVAGRVSPFIELGVGFVPDLPARDNVILNCMMLGLTRPEARERVEDVIAFAELDGFADLELKNYSSGMRARLGFSVALQAEPDVMLIDEVLAVGDASFQRKCFDQFDRIKAEGRTTLFVTHQMETLERFCDRAMVLEHGQVVSIDEPARIAAEYDELNVRARPRTPCPPKAAAGATRKRRGRVSATAVGGDLRHFSRLALALAGTEFKLHYLGSVLGYAWSVLRPLMMFGVLYFIVTEVFEFGADVEHFPVYLLTALVLWTYFSEATSRAVTSLVNRHGLIRKSRFPRMVVPVSAVLMALFNLGLNLLVVFAFILVSGVEPTLGWLELPLLVLFLIVFATGLAMLLSALYVRHRDVGQIWAVALQILFYGSPILYVVSRLPDSVETVLAASPLAIVLSEMRHAVLDPDAPSAAATVGGPEGLLVPLGIVVVVFVVGLRTFNREAPRIAEHL